MEYHLKIPQEKNKPSRIIVEINLIDEFGNPIKRRRLILKNLEDLKEFKNLINNEKLECLLKIIKINFLNLLKFSQTSA